MTFAAAGRAHFVGSIKLRSMLYMYEQVHPLIK
jgi:hypothetical protein